MARIAVLLTALTLLLSAHAHHSVGAFYDSGTISRISGTIGSVQWVNPHVRFTVDVTNASGETQRWRVEAGALNSLDRQGVPRDLLSVGEAVTVNGYASRRGRPEMVAASVDLADGQNVVLWSGLFGSNVTTAPSRISSRPLATAGLPRVDHARSIRARASRAWRPGVR